MDKFFRSKKFHVSYGGGIHISDGKLDIVIVNEPTGESLVDTFSERQDLALTLCDMLNVHFSEHSGRTIEREIR